MVYHKANCLAKFAAHWCFRFVFSQLTGTKLGGGMMLNTWPGVLLSAATHLSLVV